jgi:hypothetical protein
MQIRNCVGKRHHFHFHVCRAYLPTHVSGDFLMPCPLDICRESRRFFCSRYNQHRDNRRAYDARHHECSGNTVSPPWPHAAFI